MEIDWIFLVGLFLSGLRICLGGRRWDGIQKPIPPDVPYPCPDTTLWRSATPPGSVHQLRPGDIDVIAAIGDSLTAANGAMADNLFDVIFQENRGVSWSGGGQGNWRTFLTVPNLLKVMNPKLVGFATGDGRFTMKSSQFNMAFVGAMDQDLMMQARKLISRMKADPRVDFEKHWKMITVSIGTNDVCTDTCYYDVQGPEAHRSTLQNVLEFLRDNVPRLFINLVSMPYVPDYATLVDPPFSTCNTMQLIDCLCLFGGDDPLGKKDRVRSMTLKFQEIEKQVGELFKNDNKEDFAVVYQPTNLHSRFPTKANPSIVENASSLAYSSTVANSTAEVIVDNHDYSYVSIDCIHYSQKLQASVANTLWNNLFENPGQKTSSWIVPSYSHFLCPTEDRPFLITNRNFEEVSSENQI